MKRFTHIFIFLFLSVTLISCDSAKSGRVALITAQNCSSDYDPVSLKLEKGSTVNTDFKEGQYALRKVDLYYTEDHSDEEPTKLHVSKVFSNGSWHNRGVCANNITADIIKNLDISVDNLVRINITKKKGYSNINTKNFRLSFKGEGLERTLSFKAVTNKARFTNPKEVHSQSEETLFTQHIPGARNTDKDKKKKPKTKPGKFEFYDVRAKYKSGNANLYIQSRFYRCTKSLSATDMNQCLASNKVEIQ